MFYNNIYYLPLYYLMFYSWLSSYVINMYTITYCWLCLSILYDVCVMIEQRDYFWEISGI